MGDSQKRLRYADRQAAHFIVESRIVSGFVTFLLHVLTRMRNVTYGVAENAVKRFSRQLVEYDPSTIHEVLEIHEERLVLVRVI